MKTKKGILHPRNRHQGQYDFKELSGICPELKNFVVPNHAGTSSIDFANPLAVKTLNRALLKKFYDVNAWEIPEPFLCPPIPGRADYIHYAADLLAELNGGEVPTGPDVRVLDIGVGANCVYPIIGSQEYDWSFVGAEIDESALAVANKIIDANPHLQARIKLRLQKNPKFIFKGMIEPGETFALSICNPPFHASEFEANEVSARKWRNLGKAAVANFGGRNHELWCEGGEVAFVKQMIEESSSMPRVCLWYTSFVSKETSLNEIYDTLRLAKVGEWRTIEMAQGQKKSRFVAWTFMQDLG
jgi:23S rRNA (adenine1618-N6)-methyltransferase